MASKAIHKAIKDDLMMRGTAKAGAGDYEKISEQGIEISEQVVEDIKVRLCFVTELERGHRIQQV